MDDNDQPILERVDCVGGSFRVRSLGCEMSIAQAQPLAKASTHLPLERRPYAFRIGFSR
jgi:hypothetical protein